jgi:hypothetical protein
VLILLRLMVAVAVVQVTTPHQTILALLEEAAVAMVVKMLGQAAQAIPLVPHLAKETAADHLPIITMEGQVAAVLERLVATQLVI